MIEFFNFVIVAWRAYKGAQKTGLYYCAVTDHGVPKVACFVGLGREAWRISQRAIEEFQIKS